MGFHYEDAASQWRRGLPLSSEASDSPAGAGPRFGRHWRQASWPAFLPVL